MKKLSFCAYALLAIMFAITSAFTTSSKLVPLYAWVELEAYIGLGGFTEGTYDSTMKNVHLYLSPVFDPDDTGCEPSNPDVVCALLIDLMANGLPNLQNEDFPPDRPGGVMYHDIP